jgi:hypothetical protein
MLPNVSAASGLHEEVGVTCKYAKAPLQLGACAKRSRACRLLPRRVAGTPSGVQMDIRPGNVVRYGGKERSLSASTAATSLILHLCIVCAVLAAL